MDKENRISVDPAVEVPPAVIGDLPEEILLQIFSHLSLGDVAQSAYVCRRWHRLLKGRKSLWRRREFTADGPMSHRHIQRITSIMPRLKSVRLIFGARFGVHIAWPEATVILLSTCPEYSDSTDWVLPTHSVMVSRFVADDEEDFLTWVKTRNLRSIHVGEQCFDSITDSRSPFSTYVRRRSCNLPDCLLHSKSPSLNQATTRCVGEAPSPRVGVCPSLEQLSVRCVYLSQNCLERLCSLGPIRILRVMCGGLHSLSFVKHCATHLEVLSIRDSLELSAEPVSDLRAQLQDVKHLKVLEVSCKQEDSFRNYVLDMHHLDAIMRHTLEFFAGSDQADSHSCMHCA